MTIGGRNTSGRLTSGPMPGPLSAGLPRLTVLFIDPDGSAARLADALGQTGATFFVPSAQQALAAIPSLRPDLVVTELNLPDLDGLDLVARLRSGPATRNVLLMVITARRTLRDKINAFQAGADDYLVKPVSDPQFVLHVRALSRFRQVLGNFPFGR